MEVPLGGFLSDSIDYWALRRCPVERNMGVSRMVFFKTGIWRLR